MERSTRLRAASIALVLGAALLAPACGGGMAKRSAELLQRDYRTMRDAELQGYYQQLGDQLAREARASRMGQDRGLLPAIKAEDQAAKEALRQRWNAVRGELRQRELLQ